MARRRSLLVMAFALISAMAVHIGATVQTGHDKRPQVASHGRASAARSGAASRERAARDYLLAHPELVPDVLERLKAQETAKFIASNRRAIETPFADAWAGASGCEPGVITLPGMPSPPRNRRACRSVALACGRSATRRIGLARNPLRKGSEI